MGKYHPSHANILPGQVHRRPANEASARLPTVFRLAVRESADGKLERVYASPAPGIVFHASTVGELADIIARSRYGSESFEVRSGEVKAPNGRPIQGTKSADLNKEYMGKSGMGHYLGQLFWLTSESYRAIQATRKANLEASETGLDAAIRQAARRLW